jgi:hypothetical protein
MQICVFMYACMYVCMHACTYIWCTYACVCLFVCIHIYMAFLFMYLCIFMIYVLAARGYQGSYEENRNRRHGRGLCRYGHCHSGVCVERVRRGEGEAERLTMSLWTLSFRCVLCL